MSYFDKDDVLHLAISDEPEAGSVEVSPSITAELNAEGKLIGPGQQDIVDTIC